jgi:hypothetical protein
MLDLATMGAALGSLKTIVDLTKNANDAQLALKISSEVAQIQGRLLDVQQQALALQTENQELKAALHALTDIRDNYELRERVYFRKGTQDAYCPLCLGANSKAVPLAKAGDCWYCGIHKASFCPEDDGPGFAIVPGPRY